MASISSYGQQIYKGFDKGQGLHIYDHASRTFRSAGYALKPRLKFLFHVVFSLNTAQIPQLRGAMGLSDQNNISLLVKTIDLPKYTVTTETLNQYNRKRIVQTKINYDPVNITFHDDASDVVRNMWYNYYSYYYKDPTYNYGDTNSTNGTIGPQANRENGFGYSARDIYEQDRMGGANDWGYIGESISDGANGKPAFFTDIRIFGFEYQRPYAEYILINPLITACSHDTYDYSQGNGTMTHSMTVAYETVKYMIGSPNSDVPGFAGPAHYDDKLSPLARNQASTDNITGQGSQLYTGPQPR